MTSVVELAGADAPGGAASSNPDLRWYIVHAYSGMEKAVERNILERIARSGMQDKFGRILVPTEEVVEMKNGQRKTTERRLFPGYVFVEMVMDDDTWHWSSTPTRSLDLSVVRRIVPLPSLKKRCRKSSARCRKALTSPGTRSSSWRVSWFGSRRALSRISMDRWKR